MITGHKCPNCGRTWVYNFLAEDPCDCTCNLVILECPDCYGDQFYSWNFTDDTNSELPDGYWI